MFGALKTICLTGWQTAPAAADTGSGKAGNSTLFCSASRCCCACSSNVFCCWVMLSRSAGLVISAHHAGAQSAKSAGQIPGFHAHI
ncbi:hypothetical protein M5585_10195 [Serratia ureilytica]